MPFQEPCGAAVDIIAGGRLPVCARCKDGVAGKRRRQGGFWKTLG